MRQAELLGACPLEGASKGVLSPITLRAAEDTGKFANKRLNDKKKKYNERADAIRFGFLPIILECNGLMHPNGLKSKELFYKLAKDCSEIKRIDICILYKYYLKRISVCLQKNLSRCRLTKLAMINHIRT